MPDNPLRQSVGEEGYDDELNEAIIQSLYDQERNDEEEKMLREVMKLSAFEHKKQMGQLNIDHLKKKNNPQQASQVQKSKSPAKREVQELP